MSANVGWGRETWGAGAWNTSPDAAAVVTGLSTGVTVLGDNQLIFSEQFDNGAWTKNNSTVTADTTTAPNGTNTADTLTESSNTGTQQIYETGGLSYTANTVSTWSIYLKNNTRRYAVVVCANGSSNWFYAAVDLQTGTQTGSGSGATGTLTNFSIVDVGNGWYRCELTGSTEGTTNIFPKVLLSDVANPTITSFGNYSRTGDGSSSIFLWGAQFVTGLTQSYVPTTSQPATSSLTVLANADVTPSGSSITSVLGTTVAGASVFQPTGSVQANISTGNVSTGEGRQITITTAGQLILDLNAGSGWGRDEWSDGPWGEDLTSIVAGSGTVFIEDGQQITSSVNNVTSVIGNSPVTITGDSITVSRGNITLNTNNIIPITGEPLVSTTVDSFAVQAGGSITINTPTFEANVEVNSITIGTRANISITGQLSNISLNDTSLSTENIIPITGEELTATANTINIKHEQILSITGNEVTIDLASIVPKSENFLSITGNQANISVSSLKFWDPILPTNTETWTNIH